MTDFKTYVHELIGRTSFLTYRDIERIIPVKAKTLYNAKSSGKLRSSLSVSKAVFDVEDVKLWAIQTGYYKGED
jgi:hypothetical protein